MGGGYYKGAHLVAAGVGSIAGRDEEAVENRQLHAPVVTQK